MSMRISSTSVFRIFLAILLAGAILGVYLVVPLSLSSGHHHNGMAGCPFMSDEHAFCTMSTFEHLSLWESLFIPLPFYATLTLTLLVYASAFCTLALYLQPPNRPHAYRPVAITRAQAGRYILRHSISTRAP